MTGWFTMQILIDLQRTSNYLWRYMYSSFFKEMGSLDSSTSINLKFNF